MTDLNDLKQAAKIVENEAGEPVVQIPVATWEAFVSEQSHASSQKSRIEALLVEWEQNPANDMPDEWWDDFSGFLNENRVHFGA
jgi:hypothetical protein